MFNFKLTIEYDGTHFNGWQIQPNNQRTVQGEIEKSLKKIFKKKIRLIGSGRTDSGVHALGQVANFKTATSMTPHDVRNALNGNLPKDIAIPLVEQVHPDFHSQYSAKSKIYRYSILAQSIRMPLNRNHALHFPHSLNLTRMREEAKDLIGRKDFKSFQASDFARKDHSTIRTIKNISIKKKGPIINIDIEADGFLYKMVRNIVGTLIEIGCGKLPKGSIKQILMKKDRGCAGATVQPQGLCLLKVNY